MSKQKKRELYFILVCSIIALIVGFLCGCCHYKEYHPNGQLKKEFTGVELSEGKTISIIEIN